MPQLEHHNWQGTTDGTPWMQRMLIKWFRHTTLYVPYWCMGWIVPFYMLFRHRGYLASYRFYRHRFGMNPLRAFVYVYCNHFRFGQVIVDRFAAYAGHKFRMDVDGQAVYDELEEGESGFIQLGAHAGSYEMAGYFLTFKLKTFYALVFDGETETVMASRARMFSTHGIRIVPAKQDLSHIFILTDALRTGHIVGMAGDRVFGSQRKLSCDFFGGKASFPLGPFAMAMQYGVPMLAVFVMKTGVKSYKIYLRKLQGDSAHTLAQCFATELERIIKLYPTQWFNFYDFWT